MAGDTIVLKFGSSVLRSSTDLPAAVHEIYRWYRAGWRVIVVVSAIDNATEALLAEARTLTDEPEPNATAELLATGERHSAALLAVALDRVGIAARIVDPRAIRLTAVGSALDSEPVAVDRECLDTLLREFTVIVVPGFFAYSTNGQLHLLGRGGSDLSAVYLASAVGANRCRLVKDVDGVYESDPATASTRPQRFAALGYADVLERAAPLLQSRAVRFLERNSACAEVAGLAFPYESTIGPFDCALVESKRAPPTSVLLLGLGTVGFGVYQRIIAMPEHFRVVGALVRNRAKHAASGVPHDLLHDLGDDLSSVRADAVVDALPQFEPSWTFAQQFLSRGVSVISANKTLIDDAGSELAALAARHGASLLYSAAVGGSAPMLEALRREIQGVEIRCIAGILNGTANYVVDRCTEGMLLSEAARAAQERGFTESDLAEDLSGRGAARTLRILVRHAFGQDLSGLAVEPLTAATLLRTRAALGTNETLRVVARAWKLGNRVLGQIQLETVPAGDGFARVHDEWNRLIITRTDGVDVVVSGRGAGRWPTTEGVMANLLDLRFAQLARTAPPP